MGILDIFRHIGLSASPESKYPFDPDREYPVIKSSICTGEKTAGFKNKETGHYTPVMLIKSPADELEFKKIYNTDELRTEY